MEYRRPSNTLNNLPHSQALPQPQGKPKENMPRRKKPEWLKVVVKGKYPERDDQQKQFPGCIVWPEEVYSDTPFFVETGPTTRTEPLRSVECPADNTLKAGSQ